MVKTMGHSSGRTWRPALILALVFAACAQGGSPPPGGPHVVATIHVGTTPGLPLAAGGYVWVPNSADGTISKIDPRANRVADTIRVGDTAALQQQGCKPPDIHAVPVGSFIVRLCDIPSSLAFGAGSLWAAKGDGPAVVRIDPGTDRVQATVPIPGHPFAMAFGPSGLWVMDWLDASISLLDPAQNRVVATRAGVPGGSLMEAAGALWVANSQADQLLRVDPKSLDVAATIPVGRLPLALASLDGAVWVRDEKGSAVERIDPERNHVVSRIPVGFFLGRDGQDGIGLTARGLWVGGLDLEMVDPARGRVTERVPLTTIAVAGDGKDSLWTSNLAGTVSRVAVA
jgi:DNA-binding beta-propeller fold protein YncE